MGCEHRRALLNLKQLGRRSLVVVFRYLPSEYPFADPSWSACALLCETGQCFYCARLWTRWYSGAAVSWASHSQKCRGEMLVSRCRPRWGWVIQLHPKGSSLLNLKCVSAPIWTLVFVSSGFGYFFAIWPTQTNSKGQTWEELVLCLPLPPRWGCFSNLQTIHGWCYRLTKNVSAAKGTGQPGSVSCCAQLRLADRTPRRSKYFSIAASS